MNTKIIKYISSQYKLIFGYSVFMLGNILLVGLSCKCNCDNTVDSSHTNGIREFLSFCICVFGIGYVLVVIIKNFIKFFKNIKAGFKNKATSLRFLFLWFVFL